MLKDLFISLVTLAIVCTGSPSFAQSEAVINGVTWLNVTKTTKSNWPGVETTDFVATSAVADALFLHDPANPAFVGSLQWLAGQNASPTDYLARRIITRARAGQDVAAEVSNLLLLCGDQGAWGGESGFGYNALDTALALQALKGAGYTDSAILYPAIQFLTKNQNSDGGWGVYPGAANSTYVSALVLQTLAPFKATYPVQGNLDQGFAYLLTKQNADGGFGSSPSTVYETALAVEALATGGALDDAGVQAGLGAVGYLAATQGANGSWNDDPYSTALALRAAAQVKPDLSLGMGDISVSSQSPNVGDPLTVTARVRNSGLETVAGAVVRLLDNGVVVGEEVVAALAPGAVAEVPLVIAALEATGDHKLTVVLDPEDAVSEINENNNTGDFRVWAVAKPDLVLLPEYLRFAPENPALGQTVTLTAYFANMGETPVPAFTADLYDGDPNAGGTLLGTLSQGGIMAGGIGSGTLDFTLSATGDHLLCLVADSGYVVNEQDETNNSASKTLTVGMGGSGTGVVDLAIGFDGLALDPPRPAAGEAVTVRVQAHNLGSLSATAALELFAGDPAAGGTLIHQEEIILNAGELATVAIPWQVPAGVQTLYAVLDRDNRIAEIDEANNSQQLRVMADMVDIEVSASDIRIEPGQPMAGDSAAVTVTVHNRGVRATGPFSVALYNGDPATGGTLLQSFAVADLSGDGVQTLTHNITVERGDYRFYAVCDDANRVTELYEGNNTAIRSLSVKTSEEAQGPDLVPVELDLAGSEQDPQSLRISGTALVKVQNKGDDKVVDPYRIVVFEDRDNDGLYTESKDTTLGWWDYTLPMHPNGVALAVVPLSGTLTFRDAPIFAMADSGQAVFEQNEENNALRRGSDCEARPVLPIEPVVEWHWQTGAGCRSSVVRSPVVANMTDDNGDGRIDENDTPDLIFLTPSASQIYCGPGAEGDLHVVDGKTGAEVLFVPSDPDHPFSAGAFLAVGDINNDGFPEIVLPGGVSGLSGLLCFSHEGMLLWDNLETTKSYAAQIPPGFHPYGYSGVPVIADVDSDGQPEILFEDLAINNDGSIKWVANRYSEFGMDTPFQSASVADLDLDGKNEVVSGNRAYRSDGSLYWADTSILAGVVAMGNLDDDVYPEIAIVSTLSEKQTLYVLEHDGAIKWGPIDLFALVAGSSSYRTASPPTVADFDGDGRSEIGVKLYDRYLIFDQNGYLERDLNVGPGDTSKIAATVFDLNKDGRPEILIHYTDYFRIFDGKDGTLIFEEKFGARFSLFQAVIVADVDNDNQAEIVVSGGDASWNFVPAQQGIKVYGAKNGDWANTRKTWNQSGYHVTNINDDGSIPQYEAPSWLLNNSYNCNVELGTAAASDSGLSDLTSSFVRVDMADFPPDATIAARIGNGGAKAVEAGVSVAFYDGDPAAGGTLLGTALTGKPLTPGDYEDVTLVWNNPSESRHTVYVLADADSTGLGLVDECNEENNRAVLETTIQRKVINLDLTIPPGGLTIDPPRPSSGEAVSVTVQALNQGADQVSAVLELYAGDPATGGTLIRQEEILLNAGEITGVEIPWQVPVGVETLYAVIDRDNRIAEIDETNNVQQLWVMADMVDIEVSASDISIEPTQPMAGDPAAVTVTVHNRGIRATGPFSVALYNGDPATGGTLLQSFAVADLSGDGVQTLTHNFTAERGDYRFYAVCDDTNRVTELYEGNNTAIRSLSVKTSAEAQGPDLVPVELDLSGSEQDPQSLRISGTALVKVQNKGDDKVVDPYRIVIFEDRDNDGLYTESKDTTLGWWDYTLPMHPNGVALAVVPLNGTLTFRDAPIYAMADSGQAVFEQNEENNALQRGSECEARPVLPIEPVVEWSWPGQSGEARMSINSSPVLVNLTDDNGDGSIDENDIPDLVFVEFSGLWYGRVRALSGDTGEVIFTYEDPSQFIASNSQLAVGDIDNDGLPEIVLAGNPLNESGKRGLLVLEHDGTQKWTNWDKVAIFEQSISPLQSTIYSPTSPSLADLDGDGVVEIVVGTTVVNSVDGSIRMYPLDMGRIFAGGSWSPFNVSTIADLDMDGVQEVIFGPAAFSLDGTTLWWNKELPPSDGNSAVGNFDDDNFPEIVHVTNGSSGEGPLVYMLENDGVIKWGPISIKWIEDTKYTNIGMMPVIADFDGDGEIEIGVCGYGKYIILDKHGSLRQTLNVAIDYPVITSPPTVFDLNGDGRPEVIFNLHFTFVIADGTSGAILYHDGFGASQNRHMNVIVADVDGDDQAEVVAVGNPYLSGETLRVYGAKNNDWINTRGIWNQQSYHVTNIDDDGTIPKHEAPSWLLNNSYRANVPVATPAANNPYLSADLSASFVRVDMAEYPPDATIAARIGNGGAKAVAAGISVAFYDGDPVAGGTLIGTTLTGKPLNPGEYEDVTLVWNNPSESRHTVYVLADADATGLGLVDECNEDNNRAVLETTIQRKVINLDLTIPPGGLTIDPPRPTSGEAVTVTVQALNQGADQVSAVLELYAGDPAAGGTLIRQEEILLNAGEIAGVEIAWQVSAGVQTLYAVIDRDNRIAEINETNNVQQLTVMADMVDIEVSASDIRIEPGQPMAGDPAAVTVTVHNRGVRATGPFSVALYNGDPGTGGTLLQSFAVADLPGDGVQTLTHNFTADRGDYRFYAVCDDTNRVTELYEGNNTAIRSLSVKTSEEAQGPDLVPVELDLSGSEQDPQSLGISGTALVKVQNKGDDKVVDPYRIVVFEDRDNDGLYTESKDTTLGWWDYSLPIHPNGVALAVVPLNGTLTFRDAPIYAMADSGQAVFEQNEENNALRRGTDCEARPVNPIEPVVEWSWKDSGKGVFGPPVIAALVDDNGDGKIDQNDTPDLVFNMVNFSAGYYLSHGTIAAIKGDTGETIFSVYDPTHPAYMLSPPAVGDVDNDGIAEIIVSRRGAGLLAFNNDGSLKWDNQQEVYAWNYSPPPGKQTLRLFEYGFPAIADLDADGQAEIFISSTTVNGDGTIRSAMNLHDVGGMGTGYGFGYSSVAVDLDLDGIQEIVAGNTAYNDDSTIRWYNSNLEMRDGVNAIGNFDEDPYPEIVVLVAMPNVLGEMQSTRLFMLEHDGKIKWGPVYLNSLENITAGSAKISLPIVTDFDGDGNPEIGVLNHNKYFILDGEGNLKRAIQLHDDNTTALTSPAIFDLNGDGSPEILVNDFDNFKIFNGKDGSLVFKEPFGLGWPQGYHLRTQSVIIADVDGDNQAEAVVIGKDKVTGDLIRVYGAKNGDWVNTRRVWNQSSYHGPNINDDGSIPRNEAPSWLLNNSYRVNIPLSAPTASPYSAADLSTSFIRADMADYPASVTVTARIGNGGSATSEPGVSVAFYDGDPASGGTLIGTVTTTRPLAPGDFEDVSLVWAAPAPGSHTIHILADSAADGVGSVAECDEANNAASLEIFVQGGLSDLTVLAEDIALPPTVTEGNLAEVSVTVRNLGSKAVRNAVLRLTVGDPANGGKSIGNDRVLNFIGPQGSATVTIPWDTVGNAGRNYLYAVVDPDGKIAESSEGNNTALKMIEVVPSSKPDLQIGSGDITLSPAAPTEGDRITVVATVHNRGSVVSNVNVALYDGDPVAGGVLLGKSSLPQLIPLGGSATASIAFDSVGFSGTHALFLAVDPDNAIDESDETNNSVTRETFVGSAGLALGLSTDKAQCQANEVVAIAVSVAGQNLGGRSLTCDLQVQTQEGSEVAVVAANTVLQQGPNGTLVLTGTWNSTATYGGDYRVVARVMEGGKTVAKQTVPLAVIASKTADIAASTDRLTYTANQSVTVSSVITGTSPNFAFAELAVEIAIVNGQGEGVFAETRSVAGLIPGQLVPLTSFWNTAVHPKGNLTARVKLFDGAVLLDSSEVAFEITGSASSGEGLLGVADVEPKAIEHGSEGNLTFSLTNNGNEDVAGAGVHVLVVDPATGAVVQSYAPLTDSVVVMSGTRTGELVIPTAGLGLGPYMAIVQHVGPWGAMGIAGTAFTIKDETPPTLSVGSPEEGVIYNVAIAINAVASDSASGVDRVEYQLDGGTWQPIPLADATLGNYAVSWEPTLEDDGDHVMVVRAFDGAGNSSVSAPVSFTVQMDTTPPVTEIGVGEPKHLSTEGILFVSGATPFTLSATDDLSGVATTEYSVDGAEWAPYTPFTITDGGAHLVAFRSVDRLGNREETQTLSVIVDNSPPQTDVDFGTQSYLDGERFVVSAATEMILSATDNLSGVQSILYRFDDEEKWRDYAGAFGLAGLESGTHTIHYRSIDNVANTEAERSVTVAFVEAEVDTRLLNLPRVLIWTEDPGKNRGDDGDKDDHDDHHDSDDDHRIRYTLDEVKAFFSGALGDPDIYYTVTTDKDDFRREFRSGIYNMTVILAQQVPFDEPFRREMREGVHRGMGLLVSGWGSSVHPAFEDVFGVKFKGSLSENEDRHPLYLYASPLASEEWLTVYGRVLKTDLEGGTLAGIIPGKDECEGVRSVTFGYPQAIAPGDRLQVTLGIDNGKKRITVDEEWLTVENLPEGEVNRSTGNNSGDLAILTVTAEGLTLGINSPYGHLEEDYTLNLTLERPDGSRSTSGPVSFAPTCDARLALGVKVGPLTVLSVEEDRVKEEADLPAVVLNSYGLGHAAFFTYDLLESAMAGDAEGQGGLLRAAASYLLPQQDAPQAGGVALIENRIRFNGSEMDLLAVEQLGDGVTYIPLFDLRREPLEYSLHLTDGEEAAYRYFVRFADGAGVYGKETELYLDLKDGVTLFGAYPVEFTVGDDSETLLQKALLWVEEHRALVSSGCLDPDWQDDKEGDNDDDRHDSEGHEDEDRHDGEDQGNDDYSECEGGDDGLEGIIEDLTRIETIVRSGEQDIERVIQKLVTILSRVEKLPVEASELRNLLAQYLRILEGKGDILP